MLARLALWSILVSNGIDAGLTLAVTRLGYAVEVNPLMKVALEWSPWAFIGIKFALVIMGLMVLFRHRHKPTAKTMLYIIAVVYLILVSWSIAQLP